MISKKRIWEHAISKRIDNIKKVYSKRPGYYWEDTQKRDFFSGRTTKGVGRVNPPPTTKQKHIFFSINGKNSPGSCIMKILFYEVHHFSPIFHEFTGSKTIFAFFSPKIGGKKNCQNPFQAIIRLEKSGMDH